MPVLDFENEPLGTYTKFVGGTPTGLVADVVEDGGVKVLRLEATDGFVAAFLSDIPTHDDEETRCVMRRDSVDGDAKFYHKGAEDSFERLQCGYEQGSGVFQRGFTIQTESAFNLDPTQYFVAEVMPPSGGTLDWRIYPEGGTPPAFATWDNNINAGESGEVGVAVNNGATIFVKEIGTVTETSTDTISGTVKTSGGYPLAGATITVDGSVVATTDNKGAFSYGSPDAPDSATVDADGYDSSSESLSAGSSNDVTLALQPPAGWGGGVTLEDPNLGHYSNSQVPMWDLLATRGLTWSLSGYGDPSPWRAQLPTILALDEPVIMSANQWNSRRIDAHIPFVEGGTFAASAIGGNSSREVDLWQSDDPRVIVSGGIGHAFGGYADGTVSGPAVEVVGEIAEVTSQSRGAAFIGACAAYALQEYDANDIWTARAALRHGASGYPAWSEPNGYGELLHDYTLADPLTLDIQGPVAIEVEHTATDELTLRWQQFLMWNHQATVVKRVDGTNDDIIFEGDAASFVWDVSGVSGTVTLEFLSRDVDGNLSANISPQIRTFDIPSGSPQAFSYTPPARSYPSYTEGTLEHTIVQRFNPLRLWRPDASGNFIEESGSGDNLAPDTTHGSVTHRTGAGDLVTENSDWGVLDIKGGAFLEGAVDIPDSPAQYSLLFVVEFDTSKSVENFFQLSGTNDFRGQNNILGVSYTGVVGTFLVQADGLRGPFSSTWGGDRGALQADGVHVIGMGGFDSTAHWYNASDRTIDERNDLQWIRIDGWDTLAIGKGSISGGGSDQDERIEARIQAIALIDEAWTKEDADAVHTALTESPPAPVEETYTFAGNASPSGTLIEVLDGSTVLASTLETGGTWDTSFDMDPAELPASVTVRASASGHITAEETVTLDPATTSYTGINFSLDEDAVEEEQTYTVSGVVDDGADAIQSATVRFFLGGVQVATDTTAANGSYSLTFDRLPSQLPSSGTLEVSRSGFFTSTQNVGLDPEQTAYTVNVSLSAVGEGPGLRYVAEGSTPETALLPGGLAVRAEFYQDGYEGVATTLSLVAQGLSKRYVMRDFIADAEVSVTLDDRTGGEAAGFFEAISEARDREWRVVTFVGGAKDWEGYLLPRRVGRTLEDSSKRIVTVQAKSRFSELGNVPADELLTGTLSLAEITRRLLQPLAPLDVQAATDWYPVVDSDTFTDEPFGQLTIDTGSLQDDDGQPFTQEAALRQTHRRLQAKLIQEGGVWQVYQDERLTDGSIRFTSFDGDSSSTSTENRIIDLEADGRTVTAQSRNPGSAGQLRQQAVRYNHGTIGGQILGNLDFQNSVQTASGDANFNWRPAIDEGHSWSFNGGFVDVDTILVESFPAGVPNRFWQQLGGQIIGGPERQIAFSFDARLFAGGEGRQTAVNRLFYWLRVGDYYWNQSTNEWQTSIANNPRTFQFLQGDVDVELTTAPLVDSGQPISGQVEVRLFSGWTETDDTSGDPSFVRYEQVGFDLLTPDSEGELVDPEARLSTVQEIDTLGSEVATEESFAVGDGPTTIHASRLRFLTDTGAEVDLTDHWDKGPHTTETGTTLDELWATERLQRRRTALTRARVVISSQGPLLPAAALYEWQGKLWTWERWTYTANAGDGQQYDILLREHKQSTGEFQTAFVEERLQPFATVGQRRETGVIKFSLLQGLPEGFTTSPGLAYSDAQQELSLLLDEGAGISIVQSGDALEISATGDVGDELVRTFNTRSGDVTLTGADVTGALGFTPAEEDAQIGAGATQGFSIDTVQLGGAFQIGVPQDLRTTAGVTFNAVTATNALQIPTIGTGGSGQPLPSGLTTSPGLAYDDAQQELSLLLDEGAGISIVQSGNALEISATGDVGGAGTWAELDGKPFESVDQDEFDDSTAVLRLGTVPAAKTSGTFDVAQIPDLGAAKITAGTFDVARIPDLPASQITSGELAPQRIAFDSARMFVSGGSDLSVREIGSGSALGFELASVAPGGSFDLTAPQDLRPSASVSFDGVTAVSTLQIPTIDTGGSGQPLPSGLTTSAGLAYDDAQQTLDLLLDAGDGVSIVQSGGALEISATGGGGASSWGDLTGKPFESVDQSEFDDDTSVLRLRTVPAAKTSGTFGAPQIPDLPASRIASGTLDVARIPDLAASKITSGTFDLARIPTLGTGKVDFADQSLNASSTPAFGGLDVNGDLGVGGSFSAGRYRSFNIPEDAPTGGHNHIVLLDFFDVDSSGVNVYIDGNITSRRGADAWAEGVGLHISHKRDTGAIKTSFWGATAAIANNPKLITCTYNNISYVGLLITRKNDRLGAAYRFAGFERDSQLQVIIESNASNITDFSGDAGRSEPTGFHIGAMETRIRGNVEITNGGLDVGESINAAGEITLASGDAIYFNGLGNTSTSWNMSKDDDPSGPLSQALVLQYWQGDNSGIELRDNQGLASLRAGVNAADVEIPNGDLDVGGNTTIGGTLIPAAIQLPIL